MTARERRALMIVALDALDERKARKLLRAVALVMWPNGGGDLANEWDTSTFDEIAGAFDAFGVHPDEDRAAVAAAKEAPMSAKLRLVRDDEPLPQPAPRGRSLRLRYEQVLRDLDFAREVNVGLREKVRYLESAARDTDVHNELATLRGDLQEACEERDCFDNDAENAEQRAKELEADRDLLLRALGMSEREFVIERERMELAT